MEMPSNNGRFYPVPFKNEQKKAKNILRCFPNGVIPLVERHL